MTKEILDEQPKKRLDAIEKLELVMTYPGKFPVLVLGDRGSGKSYWIEQIIGSIDIEHCKKEPTHLYAGLSEENKDFWEQTLRSSNNGVLIIDEVEKLSFKSQDLLFYALSTTNGLYGFEQKDLDIILILTSIFPINKLRDDRRYLSAKFFDRISQFVVEFPNFETTQRNIYKDFRATWKKMFNCDEQYLNKCPQSNELKRWLESESYRMHGNFRDLDKIVINWNLYQRKGLKEVEILPIIQSEFRKLLHNPHLKVYDDNTFVFDEDSNYDQIMHDFRARLRKWSIAINNGSTREAARKLEVSHRTMERWK